MRHDDDPEKRIAELERMRGRDAWGRPVAPQPGQQAPNPYAAQPQQGWQQPPNPYPAQPQSGWQQMSRIFGGVDYEAQWTPPDQRHYFRASDARTQGMRQFNVAFMLFGVLGLPLLIGVVATFNARGSTASFVKFWLFILAMVLGPVLIFAVILLRQQRLSKRMSEVAAALGGIATRDRLEVVLDWLDAYWPWPTTMVILSPGGMLARRWCATGVHAGLRVLVVTYRRQGYRSMPKLHRTDIFIAGGRVRWDTAGDLQRVAAAYGFEVTGTEAGVHCFRRDAQVSTVDAVPDILAAARWLFVA
jgi:hypothetical protein